LNKLDEDERRIILDHYEGEVRKYNYELGAVYLQGIWDGLSAMKMAGIFNKDLASNMPKPPKKINQ